MTYLEIAETVLKHTKQPLSYIELWKTAEKTGLTNLKEIQGKTPWFTISAIMGTEIRNNPSSLFYKTNDKPTRYGLKEWLNNEKSDDDEDFIIDDNNESNIPALDPITQDINPIQDKWSVYDHIRKIKQGRLIIKDIEFQRNFVWKIEAQSRFIESILMGFPLPPFYLNAQSDGSYIIIDGLQRTITLDDYLNNKFALKGLTSLSSLNGQKFSNLPMALQAKIEDKGLNVYILSATTPTRVIYELFDRINTGGTKLSRQEVRNGIFIGNATELLKELAENPHFLAAIDYAVPSERMKDREIILRYLAFKIRGYESYTNDLSGFLEQTMQIINEMHKSQIDTLRQDLDRVMHWSSKIWGSQNFRIPIYNEKGEQKARGSINVSVLESVCYALSLYKDSVIQNNLDVIKQNYYTLTKDRDYLDAVKTSTGDKKKVLMRFELAQKILFNL